jgi:hypothetical protein
VTRSDQDQGEQWCILRTSGRQTLKLADTLGEDGFEVWTPQETRRIRIPRKNVRREITLPIMPSYVFARARHRIDLLEMERMEVKPRRGHGFGRPAHPRFNVMRHAGQLVAIEDRHLNALRQIEHKAELDRIRLKTTEPFPVGVRVRVKPGTHDAWSGMVARVVKSDAGISTVVFHGTRLDVAIRTSFLALDDVGHDQPSMGIAA